MELYSALLILLSLVALSVSDGNLRPFGSSGSYTDTLLNGIRRMETQASRNAAAIGSVVTNTVLDECYPRCPIGTVCSTDIGIRRCVAAPVASSYNDPLLAPVPFDSAYLEPAVAVVGSEYSDPVFGLGAGYNDPALDSDYNRGVVLSGAANFPGVGIGARTDLGYDDNIVRLSGCGVVPSVCRANQVDPRFLGGAYKYTFDYTLDRCVQISVCSTCAMVSGSQNNLFNSLFSCNRSCRQ